MTFASRYSAFDRALHRIAFRMEPLQQAVAEIEDRIFHRCLADIDDRTPVFITALPRAGTTLLLELLAGLDEFAAHTYRNMPFVWIPMLWDRVSTPFRQPGCPQERAHRDGMLIDADTPEALEEVIWRSYWPEHYDADRIRPWMELTKPEFQQAFASHLKKIIALNRMADSGRPWRYVSKNNLNIARIGLLRRSFAHATILVAYRDPLAHAGSLLRQHLNFLELHRRDPFVRTYMDAIGHYDFGANLRPVDFGGWLDTTDARDPTTLAFWVDYWVAAYASLIESAEQHPVCFVSHDALCRRPVETLERVAGLCGVNDVAGLVAKAPRIRHRGADGSGTQSCEPWRLERAYAVHAELERRSGDRR
ncbi:sulfotransferase [Arhodomonas sp. AD133]|uniref:sulfotransferase n=1 Tax=Arhodomonas sp. AD133 TaxID=3415009 RepID=UPI003EB8CCB0